MDVGEKKDGNGGMRQKTFLGEKFKRQIQNAFQLVSAEAPLFVPFSSVCRTPKPFGTEAMSESIQYFSKR